MIGEAGHRHGVFPFVAGGQGKVEGPGGDLGVLEEQLIEIAHAEQEEGIAGGPLRLLVLLHDWGRGIGHDTMLAGRGGNEKDSTHSLWQGEKEGEGHQPFLVLGRGSSPRRGGSQIARAEPLGRAVHAIPEAPEGRPRVVAGGRRLEKRACREFSPGDRATTAPSGLRRLAMTPSQRLTPLAIDCCPSGAWRNLRTPTSWNENGKRRLALNGQPFTSPHSPQVRHAGPDNQRNSIGTGCLTYGYGLLHEPFFVLRRREW